MINFRNIFSRFLCLFTLCVIFLSQYCIQASDTARIDDAKKQLIISRNTLSKIESSINDPDITDIELTIFRHKLKEIESGITTEASYFKKELENDRNILQDLSSLGLNDKDIAKNGKDYLSTNINEIYSEIDQDSRILIEFRLFSGEINDTLNTISDKKIKIRSKELFIYNTPFYRVNAWTSGRADIFEYIKTMQQELPGFCGSIIKQGWQISFLFVSLFVCLILFLNFRLLAGFIKSLLNKPIKIGVIEITRYRDIFHTRGFIIFLLLVKNSMIPSILIRLINYSFFMNYGLNHPNKWFELLWNLTTTFVYILYFHNIVNIFFSKKMNLLPSFFLESKKFKRRCIVMVYQFAILFTLNDIDIMNFNISINPIFSLNGTALLNLILGITISYNLFVLSPKINQFLKSAESKISYPKLGSTVVTLMILSGLILPLMVFAGASNFFTGIILNITQCFLVILFLSIIYAILRNVHPILSRSIVDFIYKASAESTEEEEKISHIEHKTPIFTYWFNFTIIVLFTFLAIVLFLLIWGVPPDVVSDWINTILFKGIPLGNQNTFPLSYLIQAVFLSIVTYYIFKGIQSLAETKVLPYTSMDSGTQKAVITTIGYIGIVASVITFIYALGVSLTALTFIISGLSVGIGFALQEFFKNFFSGFVLLIERPIKVGDLLMYHNEVAEVKKIRIRSTELVTFSRVTLIVPNSELVNNTVVNETISATTCITIRIGISYDAEPNTVSAILIKSATSTENVFTKPHPTVDVVDFADSAITYELKAFTKRALKAHVASAMRKKIYSHLKEANIEIPYPQRDIRIRSIVDTNIFNSKKDL